MCIDDTKYILYPLQQAVGSITLTAEQRIIFEERYIRTVHKSYHQCKTISYLFNSNRIIITVGSIIIPALLSISYVTTHYEIQLLYWFTWSVSICVTISNAILTLLKYDKKFYLFHSTYEQLVSEGWQFLSLTGHYKSGSKTHTEQFPKFAEIIERIMMHQAEAKYIKFQDMNDGAKSSHSESSGIPNLVNITTPANDDFITALSKVLYQHFPKHESPVSIGGPSDHNENKIIEENKARISIS